MEVTRLGDELVVRLPAAVVEELRLHEGDLVDVRLLKRQVVEPKETPEERKRRIAAAMARIDALAFSFPEGYQYRRDDAYERD